MSPVSVAQLTLLRPFLRMQQYQQRQKSEINMVIGCGIRSEEGVYGKRFRIPFEEVYFLK